jgi:hypothetical protein
VDRAKDAGTDGPEARAAFSTGAICAPAGPKPPANEKKRASAAAESARPIPHRISAFRPPPATAAGRPASDLAACPPTG